MGVDVALLLIFGMILLLDVLATIAVQRDEYAEPRQKMLQTVVIWLIPIIGALLLLGIHRKAEKPSRAYRAADSGVGDDCSTLRPFSKSVADIVDGD